MDICITALNALLYVFVRHLLTLDTGHERRRLCVPTVQQPVSVLKAVACTLHTPCALDAVRLLILCRLQQYVWQYTADICNN